MGRFLLGLLVASGLFWAYNTWGTDSGGAAEAAQPLDGGVLKPGGLGEEGVDPLRELETSRTAAELLAQGAAAEESRKAKQSAAAAPVDPQVDPQVDPKMEAKVDRPSVPLAASAGAIDRGFIHTPEGRKTALQAQAAALSMEPAEALRRSTIILEHCMRESIAKDDAQAKALVEELYGKHRSLVRQVAFNPANGVRALQYRVAAGDSLDKIAARYRKSHDLQLDGRSIATINRIRDPRSLQKDQLLRIPTDRIHVVVEKKSFLTGVYLGTDLVRLYWCSHGKPGHETPVTSFLVSEKIAKPDWFFAGQQIPYGAKENPLGTHFVKFKHDSFSGFGIHGTTEPDRMMEEVSLGCIRLRNEDIDEFFRLVPRGAEVRIQSS